MENIERTDVAQQGFSEAVFLEQQATARKAATEAQAARDLRVPAAPSYYNGQTAHANGIAEGRLIGEAERVALATHNGELRSRITVIHRMVMDKEPYSVIEHFIIFGDEG